MSLDLVIHGPRADIRTLFVNRGWIEPVLDEGGLQTGEFTNKPGLDWVPWNGSGSIMRKAWNVEASQDVDIIQEYVPEVPATFSTPTTIDEEPVELTPYVPAVPAEFGFRVPGGNFPAWLDATDAEGNFTTVALRGVNVVGRFVRTQGNFAVFRGVAEVGETLGLATPDVQFVPGFAVIVHLSYGIEQADRADDGLDEDGDTIPANYQDTDGEGNAIQSPWSRSRLMAKLRKVGTLEATAGMPNYRLPNGVRVFRYSDVQDKCINDWGTPGHVFL